MGCSFLRVIDPIAKTAWEYHNGHPMCLLSNEDDLRAGDIAIRIADIFQA